MTDKYAVIDDDGVIVNMILWDVATKLNPGEGLKMVERENGYIIGGRIENGEYIPPPPTEL